MVKTLRPDIQLMVISVYDDAEHAFKALQAGVTGYVFKNTPSVKLIESLIDLCKVGSPMSSQIVPKVVITFQQ